MAITRSYRRKSFTTAWRWAVFCVLVFALCLHVAIKFWLGPAFVEMRIKQSLAEFWSGPVRVGEIDFHYDGNMFVKNIIFCDHSRRDVLKANNVVLVLTKWPSMEAPARTIKVEQLDALLRLENGQPDLPVRMEARNGENALEVRPTLEYMDINSLTARIENAGSEIVFEGMSAHVKRAEGIYKINISSKPVDDLYVIDINSIYDLRNHTIEMALNFSQKTTPEETKVPLSAMGIPADWNGFGQVDANLMVKGDVGDIESLWPQGDIKLSDWTITNNENGIGSQMNARLNLSKRRFVLKVSKATVLDGTFESNFYIDIRKSQPAAYGGDVLWRKINLARFTEIAPKSKKLSSGNGFLKLQLYGDINSPDDLRAYGIAFIDDADLWRLPVISEVFKIFGKIDYNLGGLSDAEVVFRLWGPRMTIERGHISNNFSAIEAEQGGKINFKRNHIDIYIVGLGLKGLDKIIAEIPVVNWFAHIKNKFVRLRLEGNWSEPASKLITKQPITDIKEASIGFYADVVKSGGDISDEFKKLLGIDQENNKNVK